MNCSSPPKPAWIPTLILTLTIAHGAHAEVEPQERPMPPGFSDTPEGYRVVVPKADGHPGEVRTAPGLSRPRRGTPLSPPAPAEQNAPQSPRPEASSTAPAVRSRLNPDVQDEPPGDPVVRAIDLSVAALISGLDLPPIEASESRPVPVVDRGERLEHWPAAISRTIAALTALRPRLSGALRDRKLDAPDVQRRLQRLHEELAGKLDLAATAFERNADLGTRIVLARLRERHAEDAKALRDEANAARQQLYRARLDAIEGNILHLTAMFDRHAARAALVRSTATELRGLARAHGTDPADVVSLILNPMVVEKAIDLCAELLSRIEVTRIDRPVLTPSGGVSRSPASPAPAKPGPGR